MKKLMYFFLATFFITAQANAESFKVEVIPHGSSTGHLQEVFFDFENGSWLGAPINEINNLSAWADIDLSNSNLRLPDGRELTVLNNLPAIRNKDGKINPMP